MLMALAIARNVPLDGLTDEERSVMAHFKNSGHAQRGGDGGRGY